MIKRVADDAVLSLDLGDRIRLSAAQLERRSKAFLNEIEARFVEHGARTPYAAAPRRRNVQCGAIDMAILGIALILIGIVLAIAEAHVPGGVLGVLGGVGLAAGGLLVVGAAGGGAILAVPVAVGLAVAAGGWALLVTRKAAGAQRLRVRSGANALCGSVGVVRGWSESAGQVFVGGALWRARRSSTDEDVAPLHNGDPIVVERVDGLTLSVRPAEEWELIT